MKPSVKSGAKLVPTQPAQAKRPASAGSGRPDASVSPDRAVTPPGRVDRALRADTLHAAP